MNAYVIIEGKSGPKRLYKRWIPYVNPNLTPVDHPTQFNNNNFCLFAAFGQSQTQQIVENGVRDKLSFLRRDNHQ